MTPILIQPTLGTVVSQSAKNAARLYFEPLLTVFGKIFNSQRQTLVRPVVNKQVELDRAVIRENTNLQDWTREKTFFGQLKFEQKEPMKHLDWLEDAGLAET